MGNRTECALVELMDNFGFPLSSYRPSDKIVRVIPFNSKRKKMFAIVYNQKTQGLRVFVKGASEIMLQNCTKLIGNNGGEFSFMQNERNQTKTNVIEKFASNCTSSLF